MIIRKPGRYNPGFLLLLNTIVLNNLLKKRKMRLKILFSLFLFTLVFCFPVVEAQDVGKDTVQTEVVQADVEVVNQPTLQAVAVVLEPDNLGVFEAGDTLTLEQLIGQGKVLIQNKPDAADGYDVWIGYLLAALILLWNAFRYTQKRVWPVRPKEPVPKR